MLPYSSLISIILDLCGLVGGGCAFNGLLGVLDGHEYWSDDEDRAEHQDCEHNFLKITCFFVFLRFSHGRVLGSGLDLLCIEAKRKEK